MTRSSIRIAIVGAGIGGLTLALALRQRGLQADLFEQAHTLDEIGAAVGLSANSTRELQRLGLLAELLEVATEPSELIYRHWRTGSKIAVHPARRASRYRNRFGAPWIGIHRAQLQRVLSHALQGRGLHLGHKLVDIVEDGSQIVLTFAGRQSVTADVVIGADGVRSTVRRFVVGREQLLYSGTSGVRGLVPLDRLPSLPDPRALQFWVGPGAHLLHYAIGADGETINFLAVIEGPKSWPDFQRSLVELKPGDGLAPFSTWHPAVAEMLGATEPRFRWGLFVVPPLRRWRRGRAVLLGDAAHAMLPHHGQGANTTIEDAITLAELLADAGSQNLDTVLASYQFLRQGRVRMIQRSSWATSCALHLPEGPMLDQRNTRLVNFPVEFGWIHAFDALESVRRAGHELGSSQRAHPQYYGSSSAPVVRSTGKK